MEKLKGSQKKYLRGIAHNLKPVAYVGQKGLTETLVGSIEEALTRHELIKLRFVEFKEKASKSEIIETVEERTGCEMVGMIGHIAILFRQNEDPEKRRIAVQV